jgi:hypothetical protein
MGGVPATTIAMTTDAIIGRRHPHSWGGVEDILSALPGTNRTTLNYDSIPTSPTEQRKRLRKGGLCWEAAFVLGEHVARVESAEWNGDGRGGRGWRRRDCRKEEGRGARGWHGALRPHDVDGSGLHRLAHRPARNAGPDALERRAQLWDVIVVGGRDRLVPCAAVGRRFRLCRSAM